MLEVERLGKPTDVERVEASRIDEASHHLLGTRVVTADRHRRPHGIPGIRGVLEVPEAVDGERLHNSGLGRGGLDEAVDEAVDEARPDRVGAVDEDPAGQIRARVRLRPH